MLGFCDDAEMSSVSQNFNVGVNCSFKKLESHPSFRLSSGNCG